MANVEQIFAAAVANFSSGQFANAETLCRSVLDQLPGNPNAFHLLGLVRAQRGDPAGAVDYIRRAIVAQPTVAEFHANLGRIMLRLSDRPAAIALFRRAVELAPHDGDALTQLGIQLAANVELDAATEILARAVNAPGAPAEAFSFYGCCLQDRGDHAGAEAIFHRALALPPDHAYPAERYLETLNKGLFFGFIGGGLQGDSSRQVFMSAAVHQKRGLGRPLEILEIGTYMGASALTWAQAVDQLLDGPARLLCVDTWEYLSTEAPNEWMGLALKSGLAYRAFLQNIGTAPRSTTIDHRRGTGIEVMTTLTPDSFDIVYIDGSHAYTDVLADLKAAGRLVREGGFLCGDDLEAQLHECDEKFLRDHAMTDFILDPNAGRPLHPGVTLAVAEALGRVSAYDGFWIMRKTRGGYEPVDLSVATGIIPSHWPKVIRDMLRAKFTASGALRQVLD